MTDDLAKRWDASVATARDAMEQAFNAADEMADRIEALERERYADALALIGEQRRAEAAEARLAKAVEALRTIVDSYEATSELHTSSEDLAANLYDHARAVLAEIGGEA